MRGVELEVYEFTVGVVTGIFSSAVTFFSDRRARQVRKKVLRDRLSKDGWKWRRFESLRRAIRQDEYVTRDLLIELGARASTKRKDVWTLTDD